MGECELSAEASKPDPADDLQGLLKSVPLSLAIDVHATAAGHQLRVLGRGWKRGPAAIFSFFAVILSIIFFIAAIRALRHEGFAAMFVTGCGAIAIWVVAIWRGRFVCEFEITQPSLTVSTVAPILGSFRRETATWNAIERIAVEYLPLNHSKVHGYFVLYIRRADGSCGTYLRDYPVEGLTWLAAILERSRRERKIA